MHVNNVIHAHQLPKGAMVVIVTFLIMVFIWGCVPDTQNLKPSNSVAAMFQKYERVEGFRYYHYIGGDKRRNHALMGLKPTYSVKSRFWRQIDNGEELSTIVDEINRNSSKAPRGYLITNAQGKEVGVWFSAEHGSSIRFTADNHVVPMVEKPGRYRGGGGP
jgi:hypothetical protein